MNLTTILGILAVVVVVALIVNRRAVATLWFNLRSAFGGAATAVDNKNAVNNMKQAVEDAKSEIAGHTAKLNQSQGQINSLTRESNTANGEVATLTSRVQQRAAEVNGNTDDPILLDLAQQLTDAQTRAADAAKELAAQTTLHNSVLGQVKNAVVKADQLEKQADRLGVKLDLSATRAQLATVGINFQKSSAHSSLNAAAGYADQIQKQIDTNNGAVEVAAQLGTGNPNQTATAEWVQQQNAKATLAALGIGKPVAPATTTTTGS